MSQKCQKRSSSPVSAVPTALALHQAAQRKSDHAPQVNSSSNAFVAFKSAVSKPSVNQLKSGARSARASLRRPRSHHRRAKLRAARSSSDLAPCARLIAIARARQVSISEADLPCTRISSPLMRVEFALPHVFAIFGDEVLRLRNDP